MIDWMGTPQRKPSGLTVERAGIVPTSASSTTIAEHAEHAETLPRMSLGEFCGFCGVLLTHTGLSAV